MNSKLIVRRKTSLQNGKHATSYNTIATIYGFCKNCTKQLKKSILHFMCGIKAMQKYLSTDNLYIFVLKYQEKQYAKT